MSMRWRWLHLVGALFGLAINFSGICAQNSATPLLFPFQFNRINPAQIGLGDRPQLGASFNTQWLGIPRAPQSQLLFFENPRGDKHLAYGVFLNTNSHFVREQIQALLQFSIENQILENGFLYFGIQAGTVYNQLRFDGLQSVDSIEADILLQNQNFWQPQLGVGFYFKMEHFFFAGSVPQLIQRRAMASPVYVVTPKQMAYSLRMGFEKTWPATWHSSLSVLWHRYDHHPKPLALQGEIGNSVTGLFWNIDLQKNFAAGLLLHKKKWISIGYAYAIHAEKKEVLPVKNHSVSLLFHLGRE